MVGEIDSDSESAGIFRNGLSDHSRITRKRDEQSELWIPKQPDFRGVLHCTV